MNSSVPGATIKLMVPIQETADNLGSQNLLRLIKPFPASVTHQVNKKSFLTTSHTVTINGTCITHLYKYILMYIIMVFNS